MRTRFPLQPAHEVPWAGSGDYPQKTESSVLPELANAMQQTSPLCESPSSEDETTLLRNRLARLQAEFENARKRAVKEQEDFREYAAFETIKALIPVLDSFETALKESSSERSDSRRGMELIYKQLTDSLFKMGVRPIDATGARFDPTIHQAVGAVDTTLVEDQRVIEQLQRGYRFKDRLLRPAMVLVARWPSRT